MGRFDNLKIDENKKRENGFSVEEVVKRIDELMNKLKKSEEKQAKLINDIEIMEKAQEETNKEFFDYVKIVENNTKFASNTFEKSNKILNEVKRNKDEVQKEFDEVIKKSKQINIILNKKVKPLGILTKVNIVMFVVVATHIAISYKSIIESFKSLF